MGDIELFPQHIDGFVKPVFSAQTSDYHYSYQLTCRCGSERFNLLIGTHKTLTARCTQCGERVVVYDLALYPAATKIEGEETFHAVSSSSGRVRVMYEYGELDEDQEFDRNDLSWCRVWFEGQDGMESLILDDETS